MVFGKREETRPVAPRSALLKTFLDHLSDISPALFLMENVPPIRNDPEYKRLLEETRNNRYSVDTRIIKYSDFGAATSRRRLFTFGIRDGGGWGAGVFFERLDAERAAGTTVRDAIAWLCGRSHRYVLDHEWSPVTDDRQVPGAL